MNTVTGRSLERRLLTTGLGALAVVGIVSGCGGHPTRSSAKDPTTRSASRSTPFTSPSWTRRSKHASLIVRFNPLSFTAISGREFWLLGTFRCASRSCWTILHTTDGGGRFDRIAAPPLPTSGTVPTLRFANRRDGFAFVDGLLYVTHDGGANWKRLSLGTVLAFATADGTVYLVTATCTLSACDDYRFKRSPVFANHWTTASTPFGSARSVVALAAHGSTIWLLGTVRTNQRRERDILARSSDGGRTFVTSSGPCIPGLGGDLEPTSDRVLWAVCATGLLAGAWRSTNGGVSFAPLKTHGLANSARLAPASGTAAVLAPNGAGAPLLRTTDGGSTWRPVPGSAKVSDWLFIGFTDARVGAAIVQIGNAQINSLWRTTDGGASWSELRLKVPNRE